MPRIKDNKVREMRDAAEEIVKRYGLTELPDEMQEQNRGEIPLERDFSVGEKSMTQAFYDRHPAMRPAPKPLLKSLGPEIAPGTRAGEILESLQHQLESLSGKSEDLVQRINAFEAKTNSECTIPICELRKRGVYHLHEGGN